MFGLTRALVNRNKVDLLIVVLVYCNRIKRTRIFGSFFNQPSCGKVIKKGNNLKNKKKIARIDRIVVGGYWLLGSCTNTYLYDFRHQKNENDSESV